MADFQATKVKLINLACHVYLVDDAHTPLATLGKQCLVNEGLVPAGCAGGSAELVGVLDEAGGSIGFDGLSQIIEYAKEPNESSGYAPTCSQPQYNDLRCN